MADWQMFSYDDKGNTAPTAYEVVWVVEEFYTNGVTLGYFDGFTFRTLADGSDDCSVSYWAEVDYPEPPSNRIAKYGD